MKASFAFLLPLTAHRHHLYRHFHLASTHLISLLPMFLDTHHAKAFLLFIHTQMLFPLPALLLQTFPNTTRQTQRSLPHLGRTLTRQRLCCQLHTFPRSTHVRGLDSGFGTATGRFSQARRRPQFQRACQVHIGLNGRLSCERAKRELTARSSGWLGGEPPLVFVFVLVAHLHWRPRVTVSRFLSSTACG